MCNLACSFCPPTSRAAKLIKLDEFNNRLDQIKPHSKYIYLHVKGEPLLHPRIDELLDASHAKGFKVNITTNGTLIKKNRDKLLGKPALRQMNFSLHSFDGHEGSTNREEYLSNILSFVREAVKHKVIISFRLWNLDQDNATNAERSRNRETLEILEKEYNLDYRIEEKVVPGSGIKVADRILTRIMSSGGQVYKNQRMMEKDFVMRFAVKQPFLSTERSSLVVWMVKV